MIALRLGLLLWWLSLAVVPSASGQLVPPLASTLLWLEPDGTLKPAAHQALAVLRDAADDGLDAAHYQYAGLTAIAHAIDDVERSAALDFDAQLTHALLQYLQDLRHGRLRPLVSESASAALLTSRLREAVEGNSLGSLIQEMTPSRMNYRTLRSALDHYRELAATPALQGVSLPSSTVRPGDRTPIVPVLHRWLLALGDIPAIVLPPDDLYDGPVVEGVRRFQLRHGLDPDGVIGSATRAAMMTPLERRVRQLELALERIRHLEDARETKSLVLNIPMFQLWGWDAEGASGRPSISLRAIVGRRVTPTPRLEAEVRRIIFRPYWNVPASILRGELLPVIAADAGYVARNDIEIVRHDGSAILLSPSTQDALDGLRSGSLQLRQRPGPANALGLVKFQIESEEGVHLHGTPYQRLFERSRRAFSHGCIRVDDPVALATWMLDDPVTWSREDVIAATAGVDDREVRLATPVHVSLFYATAAIDPENAMVRFADDIYGLDAALERALAPPH